MVASSCTPEHPRRSGLHAARPVVSMLVTIPSIGFMLWLGCSGAALRTQLRIETARAVRVAELRGTISYLGEWLTMSARVAALTGEIRWVARYDEATPRLAAAIAEAVSLATPEVAAELGRTTDEANHDLVAMERAAMARAAAGDRAGAITLLDGPEFEYLQATYAAGMEAFGQDLMTLAAERTTTLSDRAWKEGFALVLAAALLVAAVFALLGRARLRRALARTEAVARTDSLTALSNRRHLYEQLHAALSAPEGGAGIALLLLDLDRFKTINDLHGHPAGDRLLQMVAARLRAAVAQDTLIARLGGDEFAIVAPIDARAEAASRSEAAAQLARRIIATLDRPFELDGATLAQIGVSIGLALAEPGNRTAEDLVQRADVALTQAKADRRGRLRFFEPGMDAAPRLRALLEGELRQAITDDLIIPHFQPLVDLRDGRLVAFEMLARWPHPVRGWVSPAEFIPLAEEIGLIGAMTEHLLRRACHIARRWPADVSFACNISPLQLRDRSLPAMIKAALLESGLAADRLELEITESALVGDLDQARAILLELKALGVRLALDDFGTGYSSLRHLQMLPFDTLKIDASFVAGMVGDTESRKIVTAVVGLAKSLDMTVVAEGVEEAETAALLRALSCDIGQGWLFGRPSPAETAGVLLLDRRHQATPFDEPRRAEAGQPRQLATSCQLAVPIP